MRAAYLEAYRDGRLAKRIERSRRWLGKCTLCPRMCRVNRLADEKGAVPHRAVGHGGELRSAFRGRRPPGREKWFRDHLFLPV